jgi:hypothetical protein
MTGTNPYKPSNETTVETKPEFVCQNCGCRLFNRVKPEAGFAFAHDYQCRQCKEQIPAPTPLWGSLMMLLLGGIIALIGAVMTVVAFANKSVRGMGLGVVTLVVGLGFISAGYRSFYFR